LSEVLAIDPLEMERVLATGWTAAEFPNYFTIGPLVKAELL
jgi:hypothetical protein